MPFPAPGLAEEADSVSGWWGLNIDESAMRLNVALAELAGKPLVQQDYCYKSRDECPERGILFRVFCCAEKWILAAAQESGVLGSRVSI